MVSQRASAGSPVEVIRLKTALCLPGKNASIKNLSDLARHTRDALFALSFVQEVIHEDERPSFDFALAFACLRRCSILAHRARPAFIESVRAVHPASPPSFNGQPIRSFMDHAIGACDDRQSFIAQWGPRRERHEAGDDPDGLKAFGELIRLDSMRKEWPFERLDALALATCVEHEVATAMRPAEKLKRPRKETRPAFDRDACFLKRREDTGDGDAEIRDWWNGLTDNERQARSPTLWAMVPSKEKGRGVVKAGIKRAKKDREKAAEKV